MRIKTYVCPSLSEAVEKIKRDLGPEAVILSTRKADADKWWLGKKAQLEVTAAIDVVTPPGPETAAYATGFGQTSRLVSRLTEAQLAPLKEELSKLRQEILHKEGPLPPPRREPLPVLPETKTETAVTALRRSPKSPFLYPEVVSQEWIHEIQRHGDVILSLCRTLLWHRLHPRIVQELSDHLMEVKTAPSLERVKEYAAEWLMERIPDVIRFNPQSSRDRVFMVLGPTGSGKTTTLVKLASHLALKEKKSVAFVTFDHYRIGAEEQLKQYAAILKVPCRLVTSAAQMAKALERLSNVDAILIDTPGCSPNDSLSLHRMMTMIPAQVEIAKALVLPATLHEPDLDHTLQRFQPASFSQLIVTKLDETSCYGSLFNASHGVGLPLSYFTMGQRVPEDFEPATKERVMDCLLNFSGNFPAGDEAGAEEISKGEGLQ